MTERDVFPEWCRHQQSVSLTILGDVSEPAFASGANRYVSDVVIQHLDRAGHDHPRAHDRIDQFRLPVALHAGDSDHLAAMNGEADVADDRSVTLVDDEVVDLQHHD